MSLGNYNTNLLKKFLARLLLVIFLLDVIPLPDKFNKVLDKKIEVKAYASQQDCIAPGYIIKTEGGGVTFDLSNRMTDTMVVESFSFKNTNTSKQSKDKKEKEYQENNRKWFSEDTLENGDIYEIEAVIYDTESKKTNKYINSFKYNDTSGVFKPQVRFVPIESKPGNYTNHDVEINLNGFKHIMNKYSHFKIEILNSDYTPVLGTVNWNKNELERRGYKVTFYNTSKLFKVNSDYIIRINADGNVYENIVSVNLKDKKVVRQMFSPKNIDCSYNPSNRTLSINNTAFNIGDLLSRKYLKVTLSNKSSNADPVTVVKAVDETAVIQIPDAYYNIKTPSDIDIRFTDGIGEGAKIATFQVSFPYEDRNSKLIWLGLGATGKETANGYQITSVELSDDEARYRIPHSWPGMLPKVHYLTMYDASRTNRIGGEVRSEVINSKNEFINRSHDVTQANFFVKYSEMDQGLNSVNFKVESSNDIEEWREAFLPVAFYADIAQFNFLEPEVVDLTSSTRVDGAYNFKIIPKGVNFKSGDNMSFIDDEGKEHISKSVNGKEFVFNDIPILMGGKYLVTLNNTTGMIYFLSTDSSILFNPTIVATNIDNQEGVDFIFDDKFSSLLNSNSSNNKVRILHENGNTTGNEFSNIVRGSNKFKLLKNLKNGGRYIVEFTNGSNTFKSTFEYSPLRVSLDTATGTTAKLAWEYPGNYLIMEGDTLNIYFKKEGYGYQAVPDAKIVHGFQNIDFDKIRTYTIKNLSPNINYTAKLELITSNGITFSSEVEFVTSNFKILNEAIDGLSENGVINKKNIDITWDVNQSDIEFASGDKIDIFLKLKSHDVFPRTPTHTLTEDLNRVRRATIQVPSYGESYSVKIVYNIGGTRHPSKVLDFEVEMNGVDLTESEVGSSSFIVNWVYPEENSFADGQEIRIFLKKSSDPNFPAEPKFKAIHGGETNLKNITSYKIDNLNEDTIYQVKLEHKIDEKMVAGVKQEVVNKLEKEIRTKKFIIDNFKISKLSGKKIKLMWSISEDNYPYSSEDKIDIYVKERSQSEYTNKKIDSKKDFNLKEVEFDLDKYDTEYDIKVAYTIRGKEVAGYMKYTLEIGDVISKIDSITNTSVTISWEYPKDYTVSNNDKIEIKYKKKDVEDQWKDAPAINDLTNNKKHEIKDLEKDKSYELKFIFTPENLQPREKLYKFKATNGFQISSLVFKNINSRTIKLDWEIYPKNYTFKTTDKLEILATKLNEKSKEDGKNEEKVVLTKTEGLSDFYSFTVENLEPEQDYTLKVKYTLDKPEVSTPPSDNSQESTTPAEKSQEASTEVEKSEGDPAPSEKPEETSKPVVVEETVNVKTIFGNFDYFILDAGASSVKFEVTYPENYEIKPKDILDIFIKGKKDASYKLNPNFTASHGEQIEGIGEVDLNEITVLDILALSPNTEYVAKAVFWPEGGKGTKIEKEVGFRTRTINGIDDIVVVDSRDHLVTVGIKMDPEDIFYSSDSSCKVYLKKKSDSDFPTEPSGEANSEMLNETHTVDAYFEELNTEYNIKVVLTIGESVYEKIIDFTSKIDDLAVEIKEVNPMTAQVEWKYPENYTLINGEKVNIFIKYKDDEGYPDKPDLQLVQSDELNLSDVNLIELSALVPDTDYEVKVNLELLESSIPPIEKSFTTKHFSVENLTIRGMSEDAVSISWSLDTEEIEFIDDYDNLGIFIKGIDEEEYNFDKPVVEFTKGLNEIRTASFNVNGDTSKLNVLVSYLVEDYESFSELKYSPMIIETKVVDNIATVSWEYPEGIEFVDGDRVDLYLRTFDNQNYPADPIVRLEHSQEVNLKDVTSVEIEDVDIGSYVLKLKVTTEKVNYSPVESNFDIGQGSAGLVPIELSKTVEGRGIVLVSNLDIDVDLEKELIVRPKGLIVEKSKSDSSFIVKNLVPGKEYKSIIITVTTSENEKINLLVKDVKIEPEIPLQEFVTNIYKFAFERFPDEQGYSYWLDKLLEKKDITGKYVLYNLMFAEREFTDRNLPDEELIKVLYQIVVNRTYDEEGLRFWMQEYNQTYLPQANNDSFEAQKAIVTRMLYEQEFRNLCEKLGILW